MQGDSPLHLSSKDFKDWILRSDAISNSCRAKMKSSPTATLLTRVLRSLYQLICLCLTVRRGLTKLVLHGKTLWPTVPTYIVLARSGPRWPRTYTLNVSSPLADSCWHTDNSRVSLCVCSFSCASKELKPSLLRPRDSHGTATGGLAAPANESASGRLLAHTSPALSFCSTQLTCLAVSTHSRPALHHPDLCHPRLPPVNGTLSLRQQNPQPKPACLPCQSFTGCSTPRGTNGKTKGAVPLVSAHTDASQVSIHQ